LPVRVKNETAAIETLERIGSAEGIASADHAHRDFGKGAAAGGIRDTRFDGHMARRLCNRCDA
jgi:hypothetical protein